MASISSVRGAVGCPGLGQPPPARTPKKVPSAADQVAQPGARGRLVPQGNCGAGG